jgi:UDP-2,4-diacetamido-2,4,6-trideoxy-beta-L-altropyranose hydrolase
MENKLDVYFRTDFNSQIGFGHYYRCISIAQIIQLKYQVNFVLNKHVSIIDQFNPYENSTYWIDDESEFVGLLKPSCIVVIDSYEFNESLQDKINERQAKLIVIDDLNNMVYDCHAIINHGVLFKKGDYLCRNSKTKFYLGLDYLMVRKEFRNNSNKPFNVQEKFKFEHVFICLGNTDQTVLINYIIEYLIQEGVLKFSILLGSDYKHKIKSSFSNQIIINTYSNLSPFQIIEVLETADFAVLSSSTILLETFTVGLPVLAGWFAENQKYSLNAFEEMGLLVNLKEMTSNDLEKNLIKSLLTLRKGLNIELNQKKAVNLKEENFLKIFDDVLAY